MLTRRNLLKTLGGVGMLSAHTGLWAAARLAWGKPIGAETYTVRDLFAQDPAGTLKKIAAVGYTEIEFNPTLEPAMMMPYVRDAGLTAQSAYLDPPQSLDDWKRSLEKATQYQVHYVVIGDNPRLSVEMWKQRAEVYNHYGEVARDTGLQFCYHAHYNEYAKVDGTSGYDILLTYCDPKLMNMEMDVFWAVYAGVNPVHYWQQYPGRFPLLHIKDLYGNVPVDPHADPGPGGRNPFAPVGKGKIDWTRIFAHVAEAGTKHIFVEQDRCNMPSMEAIKISFDYLKNLRVDA